MKQIIEFFYYAATHIPGEVELLSPLKAKSMFDFFVAWDTLAARKYKAASIKAASETFMSSLASDRPVIIHQRILGP